MSATIDGALTDRVAALLADITATEAARPPIEAEVRVEVDRLDQLVAKADAAAPSLWLSINPGFTVAAFNDAVLAAMLLLDPTKTRKVLSDRARRRAEAWAGLRLTAVERDRRLARLKNDLRVARARLEQARRQIEAQTGDTLPRVGDDPGVWLMMPEALAELAGTRGARAE